MTGVIYPLATVAVGLIQGFLATLMALLLLFFLGCALYLWRLLLSAIPGRSCVVTLVPLTSRDAAGPSIQASHASNSEMALDGEAVSSSKISRFVVLIPAHNEELVLGAALDSLNRLDYPREAFRIVVVADNCTDRTAEIAREHGAQAEERQDRSALGKGYALEWILARLLNPEQAQREGLFQGSTRGSISGSETGAPAFEAVVVLDADTLVAPNMLRVFAEKLGTGECAIQARYEVLNVTESWRTRLMSCALALAHIVKPLGRERLLLSDGLKGNGMCFTRTVVEQVPWSGESITEDIDYTIRLCSAGYRVAFAPETAVWAQMPTTGQQSASQRKRWEGGRYGLIRNLVPKLLGDSLRRRSLILLDRAIDLIIPPFAEMFAVPCMMLAICLVAAKGMHFGIFALFAWAWSSVLLLQVGYLIGGMWLAKIPMSVALTALYAPGYIVWKFGLYGVMLIQRSAGGWKRTERRKLGG